MQTGYCLVRLRNGACSVRSLADDETFHPGIGPAAEAEALYVRQLRLPDRIKESDGEFVIWDVGLGAAANALTAIRMLAENKGGLPPSRPMQLRLVSFDRTVDAAEFAIEHAGELGYVMEYQRELAELIQERIVRFKTGRLEVEWTLLPGDFPAWLAGDRDYRFPDRPEEIRASGAAEREFGAPAPHAILFDPHSPKKNPAMWTTSLFTDLFRRLDPERPCALATFTRSTMARVAMLLGGFFVGPGHPSGLKEETTVAANRLDLLPEPLDRRWLDRVNRSGSAEPLKGPVYGQKPLSLETMKRLERHSQFG